MLITNAVFQCKNCGYKQIVPQHGDKLIAPTSCPKCPCREFNLLTEESDFTAKIEVKKWKHSRPPHISEGLTEFIHPCGCKEYEKDGVWYVKQCPKHEMETDALIKQFRKDGE